MTHIDGSPKIFVEFWPTKIMLSGGHHKNNLKTVLGKNVTRGQMPPEGVLARGVCPGGNVGASSAGPKCTVYTILLL